jgi:hypothetical protein
MPTNEEPVVRVHVDADGALLDVERDDEPAVDDVQASERDEPVAPFGDERFREPYDVRAHPWIA